MKVIQLIVALILLGSTSLQAQIPAVHFEQDGKKIKIKKKKGQYMVQLKPASFSLEYKHKELMLSAGLTEELFEQTKPNIDAAKDYMSNFCIGKFGAVAKKNDWIYISGDSAMMFTTNTGAVKKEDGSYNMTINHWYKDELVPLNAHKKLYMTLWLDTNLDLFMDEKETVQVVVKFD